jgi:ribosome-associated protein
VKARFKKPRARKSVIAPAPPLRPDEDAKAVALAHRIASLALDIKADDVVILDVRGKTSYADYFVIASGDSERQVTAMAEHVETELRNESVRPLGTEGEERGQWVLLDFGEVVAHLFCNEVRTFYDLEGLWTDVPRERVA